MAYGTGVPLQRTELGPPVRRPAPLAWVRENLFSTWYNGLLTLLGLVAVYALGSAILRWALRDADWTVVTSNFTLLMVGPYPRPLVWRVWAVVVLIAVLTGVTWGMWGRSARLPAIAVGAGILALSILPLSGGSRFWLLATGLAMLTGLGLGRRWSGRAWARRSLPGAWVLSFPLSLLLLHGLPGSGLLPPVGTANWGGFLLTVLLAVAGTALSFPFGVLLALGRSSTLPVVRLLSIAYIEVFRGVPLITVLYGVTVLMPMILPGGMRPDLVLRAVVGIVVFQAAYVAENVRGGLQAIPRGQIEAAQALGLSGAQVTFLVVLPQALRAVIPAMVGQFISLFKDTSLVLIVGLQELVGTARAVLANPKYLGKYHELYVVVGLIFWVFCYAMSYASRRIERQLGVGER